MKISSALLLREHRWVILRFRFKINTKFVYKYHFICVFFVVTVSVLPYGNANVIHVNLNILPIILEISQFIIHYINADFSVLIDSSTSNISEVEANKTISEHKTAVKNRKWNCKEKQPH